MTKETQSKRQSIHAARSGPGRESLVKHTLIATDPNILHRTSGPLQNPKITRLFQQHVMRSHHAHTMSYPLGTQSLVKVSESRHADDARDDMDKDLTTAAD